MGQLTVRKVDDAILQALRRRAATAGHSTEEEARRSLAMAVGIDREAVRARLVAVRMALADRADTSTERLVRESRDGRTRDLLG